MTKRQFLDELRARLSPLPQLDIEKTIAFYSEMIDDRMDDGLTEEEAVSKMESPAVIANRIISESNYPPVIINPQPQKQKQKGNYTALWITLAVLGLPIWGSLLLTFICVVLTVYISIWAVIISLFAAAIALAVSAVGCMIAGAVISSSSVFAFIFSIGAALVCAGISILMFIVSIAAAKGIVKITAYLFRKLRSAFSRKKGV